METAKALLCVGAWVSAWSIAAEGDNSVPKAENVHWVSLDFKTVLNWTVEPSSFYTYTVLYSVSKTGDWSESPHCIQISQCECDLTSQLSPLNRVYEADVRTERKSMDYDEEMDDLPHTFSPPFNPYTGSNISAVEFSLVEVDQNTVIVNITDPVTSIHRGQKQLTIRDVLQKDLKYKILYYKTGSTRQREVISDSSTGQVSGLDEGVTYCFMVAAYIPSRPKANRQGALSKQLCRQGDTHPLKDLSAGAWAGIVFILLIVLIISITVTVLCCRRRRQRNKNLQTSLSSAPI